MIIYLSEKQKLEYLRRNFNMSKEDFSKNVLGFADQQGYTNYLDDKADLSIDTIRAIANYDRNINIGSIFSKEEAGSLFIYNKIEFDRHRKSITKIEALEKEIQQLNQALKDKERIIILLQKNQK